MGSQGTPFVFRALYEVTATGQALVAEEFQINTHVPGQRWGVEFTDNNRVVFVDIKTSTGGPVDGVNAAPANGPGGHTVRVHAKDHSTAETAMGGRGVVEYFGNWGSR